MSPLPHEAPPSTKPKDEAEVPGVTKLFGKLLPLHLPALRSARSCRRSSSPAAGLRLGQQKEAAPTLEEDREEEISGAQFLCETVMRSLTLEEAPDHRPLRRTLSSHRPQGETPPPRHRHAPSFPSHPPPLFPAVSEAPQDGSEDVCPAPIQSPGRSQEEEGRFPPGG